MLQNTRLAIFFMFWADSKKKSINSTWIRAHRSPPCIRISSASVHFPLGTEVGPLDRSDVYDVRVFHVQRHLTAANEWSPSFSELQPLCLCLRQDRNPVLWIQYITLSAKFNIGNRPEQHIFRLKIVFLQHVQVCCTSFGISCSNSPDRIQR